jgi:hypothetical protein
MKNNQYYEDLEKEIIEQVKKADGFVKSADQLTIYHEHIKGRKGIFKIVDKLICWEIRNYWKMANRIYTKHLKTCIDELDCLRDFLNEKA